MTTNHRNINKVQLLPSNISLNNDGFTKLLIKTRVALGELNGYITTISKPTLFSSVYILQSLASSETEDVNTSLTHVLQNQLLPKGQQDKESRDVLNYRNASVLAFWYLKKNHITNQMVRDIQSALLPTESHGFRTSTEHDDISGLMDEFEKFIRQKNDNIDPLIKSILTHYQLHVIHPFKDGNGRVARIIMILFLVQERVLSLPIILMSDYIYKNRTAYYHKLLGVAMNEKWNEYITFMLRGFYVQAIETKRLLIKIMLSFDHLNIVLGTNHKKIYSKKLVEALYTFPIISPVKLAHELGVHYTTASRYLIELSKSGILSEEKFGKYHLFGNIELLRIIGNDN